jgi:subtilisin family serine protease
MKRFLVTAATATLFLSLPVASMARADQDESEGSYIVVMRSSDDLDGAEVEIAKSGGRTEKRFSSAINALSVKMKHSEVARIRNNPRVLFVELDQPMYALDTQSPTPSWGLDRVDQRALPFSNSFTASAYGAGVDVYIVDTGIFTTHTDFSSRLRSGFSAINDRRGSNDCNGHGTHVAGTAAGATYGVAKAASIIPVRVLDCKGSGSTTGVIAGLDWIVQHHVAGKPSVANMSLGGGVSSALDTAVQNVINDGVVMAVAAGNSNADACNSSPARAANAITVGATERTDIRASYSNFGTCLDIFAPGSSITSAWINSTTATNTISGTSMASPHVAGVAAVLLDTNPTSTPAEIAAMLRASATPNLVTSAGTGSPNYLLYLDLPDTTIVTPPAPAPTAPAAPTIGTATANRGKSATVSWTQGSDGGSAITSHVVNAYINGSTTVSKTVIISGSTATSATVTGLTAGRSYTFRVQARNTIGDSPLSASSNSILALK